MFVEITQEKIDLISKIIKNDRKFKNNEDLFEDFLNEACHRSAAIINSVDNIATLEAYLRKVVTTSIISVLKDLGRLRRTKTGYTSVTEVPVGTLETVTPVAEPLTAEPTDAPVNLFNYASFNAGYADINIPLNPEDNAIHNEVVNFIADTLERINEEDPAQRFMDIFVLRYDKGLTQREMAQELGISQSEVSKRIYSLIERVKNILDEQ